MRYLKLIVPGLLVIACVAGNIQVPRRSCLVSYNDFRNKIMNERWIGIYDVDDDATLFPGLLDTISLAWYPVSSDVVRRVTGFYNQGTSACSTADGNFRLDDSSNAIFVPDGADSFATPDRREWFVSKDPDTYAIWVICREAVVGNICPTSFSTIMVKDPRGDSDGDGEPDGEISLNFIPWKKVAWSLKCIGRCFTSTKQPVVRWSWKGENVCPLP